MGTIIVGEDFVSLTSSLHQHPAVCCLLFQLGYDWFDLGRFSSFIENSTTNSHVVDVDGENGYVRVSWFYVARGGWPADIEPKFLKLNVPPEHVFGRQRDRRGILRWYAHWDRHQLCRETHEHTSTDGNCDIPKDLADRMIARALEDLRDGWIPPFEGQLEGFERGRVERPQVVDPTRSLPL